MYPRIDYGWQTAYDYAESMKTGAKFPPITVNKYAGKYYLIDGKHRLGAYELYDEEYVEAEILRDLSEKEIYIESVKRNISHGQPFVEEDIDKIKIALEDFKLSYEEISEIIRVPTEEMKPVIATKIDSLILKPKEEISSRNRISSKRREIEIRNKQIRLENLYSVEHFVSNLYKYSLNIENFVKHLESYEKLKDRDNLFEIENALDKIEEGKKLLDKIKTIIEESKKGKEIKVESKVEQELHEGEQELESFDGDGVDEYFDENYGENHD